jgi:sugar phosphate permease
MKRRPDRGLLAFFRPASPLPVTVHEPQEVQRQYGRWQTRVLFATIIGYAAFYFVRVNLPMAMPEMKKSLGIDYKQLGVFLSLNGVVYGISKFANGYFGDRANARAMMVAGLLVSAFCNLAFGLSSTAVAFGLFWMINGWVQGMGFPPCARLMTHWFPPRQLATKMSVWNMSHQIGGGLVTILCGCLISLQWGWRSCFFVPAVLVVGCVVYLWRRMPDTPASVGLPEVEGTQLSSGQQSGREFNAFVWRQVFKNKYIWLVSFSNFFVYTIRYSIFNWGPTMLADAKHIKILKSGFLLAGFEWSGLAGALVSGWMADRFFGGRVMRVGVFYMALAGVSVFFLWRAPGQNPWLIFLLFCSTGFFIYGPQCLVSIAAANLATKRAAATAVGLTSIFGYASTVLSGSGVGAMAQDHGWDPVFQGLLVIAGLGVIVFASCWKAKAHGYE